MIILFSAFVVIYTAVVVLAGFTVKAFHGMHARRFNHHFSANQPLDFVEYSPLLGTCYVQKKPLVLIGVWAGMVCTQTSHVSYTTDLLYSWHLMFSLSVWPL